jgi:hypothetical protein
MMVDANFDGVLSTLTGQEDWSRIVYNFRESPTFHDGVHGQSIANEIPVNETGGSDVIPPTSQVRDLSPFVGREFSVTWNGTDNVGGSGIAAFDVFVSDNDGPFTLWQSGTTATAATFQGQVGHRYGFYSIARDRAGNIETKNAVAEAEATVRSEVGPRTGDYSGNGRVEQADLDLVLLYWGRDPDSPPGWVLEQPSGIVDQEELDAVLLHWGETVGGARPGNAVDAPRSAVARPTSARSLAAHSRIAGSATPSLLFGVGARREGEEAPVAGRSRVFSSRVRAMDELYSLLGASAEWPLQVLSAHRNSR